MLDWNHLCVRLACAAVKSGGAIAFLIRTQYYADVKPVVGHKVWDMLMETWLCATASQSHCMAHARALPFPYALAFSSPKQAYTGQPLGKYVMDYSQ